ncbi:hypothetical protein [Streptomyces echinatus]|uniref:hypothetical protein n=1 Tax=Streptomyces echinatus TaxID=67293 RepID=UPI0031E68CA3
MRAPAERLADAGVTGPFDAVFPPICCATSTIRTAVLTAVRDLLVAGGRLGVHEFTLSGRRAAPRRCGPWSRRGLVQPAASALGGRQALRHLWRSVVDFDTAARFAARVRARPGFAPRRTLPLPGWQTGITHTVRRPAPGDRAR